MTEEGLAERISTYLLCSKADKTTEKYNSCFKKFKHFVQITVMVILPANNIFSLICWIKTFHIFISSVFYALKWVHNINSFVDPTENGFVKGLLDSAKRMRSQPIKRKDVVNTEMLISLCDQLEI